MASSSKAAAARAKAQSQVKAQERRTTMMIVAGIVAAVLVFGGLVYYIISQNQTSLDGDLGAEGSPAGSLANGAIPVAESGVAGTTNDDAVQVDVYLDLLCPYCNVFEQTNGADLDELREAGTIQVNYHVISILDRYSNGTAYSTRSANALATVANYEPEYFLDYLAVLYANQPAEGADGLSDDELAALAVGVGVSADTAGKFEDLEFRAWVASATEQASIDGMQGTPTMAVNGEIIPQETVPYFGDGTVRAYLEQVAAQG
ncbi:thioredoxin domain-containing protein [Demequina sp. NBRC 110052]|uniref:DsbA family protein n=1 Tax=Demequina sp. NBRC 110052 TaxID=1570341 RepID=UPI000A053C5C|nr:thioredoxin domain-containing protein [Demequina sp. NBRC 110052]